MSAAIWHYPPIWRPFKERVWRTAWGRTAMKGFFFVYASICRRLQSGNLALRPIWPIWQSCQSGNLQSDSHLDPIWRVAQPGAPPDVQSGRRSNLIRPAVPRTVQLKSQLAGHRSTPARCARPPANQEPGQQASRQPSRPPNLSGRPARQPGLSATASQPSR